MLLRTWSLRSRRNWIISSAVHWAAPMSVLFGGVFYAQGGLTPLSAVGIFLCTSLGGLGFAAVYCAYLTEKYGICWRT